jgi:hypothetical protein
MRTQIPAVAVLVAVFSCGAPIDEEPGVEDVLDTSEGASEAAPVTYKLFNPASYAGYDPTGATESSASFQAAIDAASKWATDHASQPAQYGLRVPAELKTSAGANAGPNQPQAIVRVDGNGVFKIDDVHLKSNVRLEIHASSTLIPVESDNAVMLFLAQSTGTSTTYLSNVTITAWGTSTTFRDTGRRCTEAGKSSPCSLPKKARYAAVAFPDGNTLSGTGPTSLVRRFTADRDPRRYPNADHSIGNTPRGGAIKARQVRDFLVERMFYLAHPGEVLTPQDNPPGPTAIGSNTYPATAGNGFSAEAISGVADFRPEAVQPRNGTIRNLHCEDCTRGYGILEIHSGVDLEYRYISTRGGIAIRWESANNGRSTRQTAQQVVGVDCNTVALMSTHENNTSGLGVPGPEQDTLRASFVKAIGCDNGIRSETAGGTNVNSSFSDVWILPGNHAQVIRCRGGGGSGPATPDGCSKYGVAYYDDDAWTWEPAQIAIKNSISIPLARIHCVESQFVKPNLNGECVP